MTREELAQRPDLIEAGKANELPHGLLRAKRPNVAAAIEAVPAGRYAGIGRPSGRLCGALGGYTGERRPLTVAKQEARR